MSKPGRRPAQRPSTPSSATASSATKGKKHRQRKHRRLATAAAASADAAPARARRGSAARAIGGLAIGLLGLLVLGSSSLLYWSWCSGPGNGRRFVIDLPPASTPRELSALLEARGALRSPRLFRAYWRLLQPGLELRPGGHLLNDAASPRELALRVARDPARSSERVTVPEGFQFLQIGQRLEHAEVCTRQAFQSAVGDPALLRELGIAGASAEGYLFPASYTLLRDSDARAVVRVLVSEAKARLQKLFRDHPGRFDQLAREEAFSERDVLTLASIIEKEAQADEERPLIASVFLNRLQDPTFRPARMLQSDPTASYGCLVNPAGIPSCAGFRGVVTPALLRDSYNTYNTYKHAGLPPGPIANPGEASILAVLAPAHTDYLYFVARGAGRHTFSRTFTEHREALGTAH